MPETVGVRSWIDTARSPSLKRAALLFDKVGITELDLVLRYFGDLNLDAEISDLEWLCQQEVAFDLGTRKPPAQPRRNEEFDRYHDLAERGLRNFQNALAERLLSYEKRGKQKLKKTKSTITRQDKKIYSVGSMAADYEARCAAIQLRDTSPAQAFPILSSPMPPLRNSQANKVDVVQIVLYALPQPSETVPWEQIIEYRHDPDSQHKVLDLRHWMTDVARGDLTDVEVAERIEYLISRYQRHLELHRMKVKKGALQTTLISSAEFAENLAKFRLGRIAQNLFSLKRSRIALMEGELTSPGSELAYIVKARERFSSRTYLR